MTRRARARNYIDGKWSWPKGAGELKSLNPADTRDVVCTLPDSPASEVDRAVEAATKALKTWRARAPPGARGHPQTRR